MWGKTTMSRSGRTGNVSTDPWGTGGRFEVVILCPFLRLGHAATAVPSALLPIATDEKPDRRREVVGATDCPGMGAIVSLNSRWRGRARHSRCTKRRQTTHASASDAPPKEPAATGK